MENVRNFQKPKLRTKKLFKNPLFMFLADLNFCFTIKKTRHCSQKEKLIKSFRCSYVLTCVKKKIMVAEKNSHLITLVTKITLLQ